MPTPVTKPAQHVASGGVNREVQSISGLIRRLTEEVSTLFRQEVKLAVAEGHRSLTSLIAGASSIAAAGAVLFSALLVLLAAAVLGLAEVLPAWAAALIVGFVTGILGYVLLRLGRAKFDPPALLPIHSVESIRQDKDVLTRNTQ
jgi:hypothetical protein